MSGHPSSASQQENLSEEAQRFWLEWVEAALPYFHSRAYFLPPVFFNRVPMTRQPIAGQDVLVLHKAPGQAGQPAYCQSKPGRSSPGQTRQSTPCGPTPGQIGQSTPEQTDRSKAGQAGHSTPVETRKSTPGQEALALQPRTGLTRQTTLERLVSKHLDKLLSQNLENMVSQHLDRLVSEHLDKLVNQHLDRLVSQHVDRMVSQHINGLVNQHVQTGQSETVQTDLSTPEQAGHFKAQAGNIKRLAFRLGNFLSPLIKQKAPQKPGTSIQDSDVRDDAASRGILCCLQKMSEENGEVLVGLSQLQFGQYLGEPCYAAAAAQLPVPANLPSVLPQKWKRGDFDVLLIHRHYGLVVFEVKAFGDNVHKLNMSQQDIDNNIRKKLTDAVSQLDKAEAMLSHLVSDVTPGLRITKTIAVPNLTAYQVQQAISGDPLLTQNLCRCLGTTDPADIPALCLCSDQLSDPKTPWEVTSDVLMELGNWWQRRVAVSGPDNHVTFDVYKTLVARFCGPATVVTVPCTSPPRLCVKTLGQAVSWTGECYTAQITLFPEQVDLLNTAPPRLFVSGPPGTGKTVVLLLMATEWLRCANDVHIVSTRWESRAACIMLYHLLLHTINTQLTSAVSHEQLHFLHYDLKQGKAREKALTHLSKAGKRRSLYVIADEAVESDDFQTFCDKLLTQVPDLHLWAAGCYHGYVPDDWQVENLTRPLRSPPAVVREVQQDWAITKTHIVQPYSERGVADHTDGPPVRRLYHRGQGHSDFLLHDCETCGREVAIFLHSLRVPGDNTTFTTVTTTRCSTTPPCLQWRDVLVLCGYDDVRSKSDMVAGLRKAGIPVRVMKDHDTEDVATIRSDVVWVAHGCRIRGLERKVVICLEDAGFSKVRLHFMSRCTSQLVIVSY